MNPQQLAQARENSYLLFGRLYLYGLDEALLPHVTAVPPLAEALPRPFHPDEAAAAHQQLFGFHLPPYQSLFLDPAGLLGGPESERVLADYRQSGFRPAGDTAPDHLGQQLMLLAFLCAAEADAWEDNLPHEAGRLRQAQAGFLQRHLLRWLTPVLLGVQREEQPFYSALATLTAALIHDHLVTLPAGPSPPFILPEPEEPPAGPQTSLADIARTLLTPPYSGLYLGRGGVGRLARALALPRGFGSGRQMLTNLMRTAGHYDRAPALFAALLDEVNWWQAAYASWQESYPAFRPFVAPWEERVRHSAGWLKVLAQRLAEDV